MTAPTTSSPNTNTATVEKGKAQLTMEDVVDNNDNDAAPTDTTTTDTTTTNVTTTTNDTTTTTTVTDNVKKADELWRQAEAKVPADFTDVYNFLMDLDKKYQEQQEESSDANNENKDHVHVLWRLARACKDMSEQMENNPPTDAHHDKKKMMTPKQYAMQGRDIAKRAVQLDPTVWEAHMFHGALLGVGSRFEVFHKLRSAREMKDCFVTACDLAGDSSPEPYHSLGQAEFGFAEAGRAARLLGLRGTYQDAYEHFVKVESLCPHECWDNQGGYYNRNRLMIVKSLKAMGKKEEARVWLDKLLEAEINTHDDRAAFAEAKTIKL